MLDSGRANSGSWSALQIGLKEGLRSSVASDGECHRRPDRRLIQRQEQKVQG